MGRGAVGLREFYNRIAGGGGARSRSERSWYGEAVGVAVQELVFGDLEPYRIRKTCYVLRPPPILLNKEDESLFWNIKETIKHDHGIAEERFD